MRIRMDVSQAGAYLRGFLKVTGVTVSSLSLALQDGKLETWEALAVYVAFAGAWSAWLDQSLTRSKNPTQEQSNEAVDGEDSQPIPTIDRP